MSKILMDIPEMRPGKLWRVEPTPPPPKERIPALALQDIYTMAQVQAFRAAMAHVRKCGDLKYFPEDEAYAMFKRHEMELVATLTARWLVEHGQDS